MTGHVTVKGLLQSSAFPLYLASFVSLRFLGDFVFQGSFPGVSPVAGRIRFEGSRGLPNG